MDRLNGGHFLPLSLFLSFSVSPISVLSHGELDIPYASDHPYKPENVWTDFTADTPPPSVSFSVSPISVLSHGELGILYAFDHLYKPWNLWTDLTADSSPPLSQSISVLSHGELQYPVHVRPPVQATEPVDRLHRGQVSHPPRQTKDVLHSGQLSNTSIKVITDFISRKYGIEFEFLTNELF